MFKKTFRQILAISRGRPGLIDATLAFGRSLSGPLHENMSLFP
jgi:hypothetical protein